jgi:hypothetical protein
MIEQVETLAAPRLELPYLGDFEVARRVLELADMTAHFQSVIVIRDPNLRNWRRFPFVADGPYVEWTERSSLAAYRRPLEQACYSHGHCNVVFVLRNIASFWQSLVSANVLRAATVRPVGAEELLEVVQWTWKRDFFRRLEQERSMGWVTLWHDANFMLVSRSGAEHP